MPSWQFAGSTGLLDASSKSAQPIDLAHQPELARDGGRRTGARPRRRGAPRSSASPQSTWFGSPRPARPETATCWSSCSIPGVPIAVQHAAVSALGRPGAADVPELLFRRLEGLFAGRPILDHRHAVEPPGLDDVALCGHRRQAYCPGRDRLVPAQPLAGPSRPGDAAATPRPSSPTRPNRARRWSMRTGPP